MAKYKTRQFSWIDPENPNYMGPTMIKNANNMNVARMRQENQSSPTTATTPSPLLKEETSEEKPIWKALANFEIKMSM